MSSSQPLRVGIVGANAKQSWAKGSHVPAIQSLSELKFAAGARVAGAALDRSPAPLAALTVDGPTGFFNDDGPGPW